MPALPQTQNLKLQLPPPEVWNSIPNWGEILNNNFQLIDALGNPVTPAGMDINADLDFNGFAANDLKLIQFDPQSGTFSSSFLNCVYSVAGDLYWNNGSGTAVRLTNGNSIVGAGGTISGMTGAAAVAYNAVTGFTFTASDGSYSALRMGALTLYDGVFPQPSNGVSLKSPSGLASAYNLTFPAALPSSGKTYALLSTDAGVMSFGALQRGQMAAQSQSTVNPTGTGWTGSLLFWQDQVGMCHLMGTLSSTGATSTVVTLGVAPSQTVNVPVYTGGLWKVASIDSSGVLTVPAASGTVSFDAVAYLGNN